MKHLHLVSDSTGETVNSVTRACLVQFEKVEPIEHAWTLVRTRGHLDKVLAGIRTNPGPVLFTMVDASLRKHLESACKAMRVPHVDLLGPVIKTLGQHYDQPTVDQPGRQHELDSDYFERIEAMSFALAHDDGQLSVDLLKADVVLVGVSRTSKTPTCIYLANRGILAANVPFVPGIVFPDELLNEGGPFVVGLTKDARRLADVRRSRMRFLTDEDDVGGYADISAVKEEVSEARRFFTRHNWPVIDVTRRSIEETAAAVLNLYQQYLMKTGQTDRLKNDTLAGH